METNLMFQCTKITKTDSAHTISKRGLTTKIDNNEPSKYYNIISKSALPGRLIRISIPIDRIQWDCQQINLKKSNSRQVEI